MIAAPAAPSVPATPHVGAPWYFYAAFIAFVILMLLVDLRIFHRRAHAPSAREAGAWVGVWVTLALSFGAGLWIWKGSAKAIEFFTGYLVEYSLSVDNLFVFIVIFTYFGIPRRYQHRVLFFGILGAIVFRGIFIALGVALINRFEWILYVFGAFLLLTAVRMAIKSEEIRPDQNPVLKFLRRRMPTTTNFDGQKFFVTEAGRRVATPLLVVLVFIEFTDIVFAVDSIPAIFVITQDPFIVLTSNVFAILGLRALYFLLSHLIQRLHLLRYGLALILGFVGTKMLLSEFVHVEGWVSLTVIVATLAAAAVISLLTAPSAVPPLEEPVDDPAKTDAQS